MKKALAIAGFVAILASGGFIYQANADKDNTITEAPVTTSPVEQKKEVENASATPQLQPESEDISNTQGAKPEGTVDISSVPANEVFVPKSVPDVSSKLKTAAASDDIVLKESEILARVTNIGLQLTTFYKTQTGSEIIFNQVPATLSEEKTIESLKNSYNTEKVEVTEINGHTAAYVDGAHRKVVHLITPNHFFTASTVSGSLDDVMNVISQIKE